MKNSDTDASSERTNKLADEILGAHQARADFLKWKLILVAGLGAAGLGLGGENHPLRLLLALIPLVCLYVDLLCTNLKVRIIVIGSFFANLRRDSYERYTQRNRDVFQMEDWALHWSTLGVCIIVGGIGLLSQTFSLLPVQSWVWLRPWKWYWHPPSSEDVVLIASALFGVGLVFVTNWRSDRLLAALSPQIESDDVQRAKMEGLLHDAYSAEDLKALRLFLTQKGLFIFPSLPNGLFSASASASANDVSGYQYVWVRDNIHIAHAHFACGDHASAKRNLSTLMAYFQKHRQRFQQIINDPNKADPGKALATEPMNRPHIRFDGRTLDEIEQKWAHAQNDALGYFLWCYCKLVQAEVIQPDAQQWNCLADFPLYFEAIRYWQDRDSGHWEEARKVSASSIGVVVAGLREFERLLEKNPAAKAIEARLDLARLRQLREAGEAALKEILPCESVEPEECYRRYDSALLFLIYPLEVIEGDDAATILKDVQTHLQGDYGIRRYLGDSYWFPDYKKVSPAKRTADFSDRMAERNAHMELGREAQWCIFDPIVSVIYGQLYLVHKKRGHEKQANELLRLQTVYFNRALKQLTIRTNREAGYRAPEAYYLEEGRYVPNDHTPLLWTQANLWLAINQMERSVMSIG